MNPETKGKHNVGKDQDKGKEREKEGTGDAMKIKRMTNEIGDGGEIKELLYLKPKKKKKKYCPRCKLGYGQDRPYARSLRGFFNGVSGRRSDGRG